MAVETEAAARSQPVSIAPRDILARLTSLKSMDAGEMKALWRRLNDHEPPPFNKRYLESRLAWRIQELAFGGLKPETVRRLEKLGEQLDGGREAVRKKSVNDRPVAGTRLLREWRGNEYTVTVLTDAFEWEGRPYTSLSAVARAITGTNWNGQVFFGLKRPTHGAQDKGPVHASARS